MKYETKTRILAESEKKAFIQKMLEVDSKFYQRFYKHYRIGLNNLVIKEYSNGFNADTMNEIINQFYVIIDYELFNQLIDRKYYDKIIINDNFVSTNGSFNWCSSYNKDYINTARKNKKFKIYVFEGEQNSPRKKECINYMVDRFSINYTKYTYYSNMNGKYISNLCISNKDFQQVVYNMNVRIENNDNITNYVDKSGYWVKDRRQNLKSKAKELKKQRLQDIFNNLDKQKYINEINNHYNVVINDFNKKMVVDDLTKIDFHYSYYYDDNFYSFVKLYRKLLKWCYTSADSFFKDYKVFKNVDIDSLENQYKKYCLAQKISEKFHNIYTYSLSVYNGLTFNDNEIIVNYDGFTYKYDINTLEVIQ